MEFRTLHPDELDAWAAHCGEVFSTDGNGVDKSYFLRHFANDPWRDFSGIFVAVDDGSIVSTVRAFRRKVWIFGEEIPAGGIGEVSTKAAWRGRNLAGTLLTMALAWMERHEMTVSMLYAGAHDFYRRFGWECIAKPFAKFEGSAAPPCEGRALTPDDLPQLAAVEAASVKTNWMVVRKDPAYWKSWIAPALEKGFVALESGRIVAWLLYKLHDETWEATEFRALPGYEDKFYGLCALAAASEGMQERPYLAPAWLDMRNEPRERFDSINSMVRLISPFNAGGVRMGTTGELIEKTGEYRDSELDHF